MKLNSTTQAIQRERMNKEQEKAKVTNCCTNEKG